MKNYSQNNEQQVIMNYLAENKMYAGKFLDIGAYDGETFSNTREIMLALKDWSGVFIEPSSYCFYKLCDMYKAEPKRAELINLAVVLEEELTQNRLLEFYDSPMSAVSSTIQNWTERGIENNKEYNEHGDLINPRKVWIGQIGMKEILNKFGPFDFINIDVEGYSAKLALQDWFNPRDYGCKILCVENDHVHKQLYEKFTTKLGYRLIENRWENMIFVI